MVVDVKRSVRPPLLTNVHTVSVIETVAMSDNRNVTVISNVDNPPSTGNFENFLTSLPHKGPYVA